MNQVRTGIIEIPITVRVTGDPIPIICKIFEINENSKEAKFTISRSVLIGEEIECKLKEYIYRNNGAPHDIVVVFGIPEGNSKSSEISQFLHEKLHEFKKTMVIIREQEVKIEPILINNVLEKMEDN
ncbi:hypothetical protein [Nitrosopumilus sp.]|uniref:hypothetical protein n=1 Tax=Nitrosopumilus sp. TaxID=2024843 RepID=UPI003B5BE467